MQFFDLMLVIGLVLMAISIVLTLQLIAEFNNYKQEVYGAIEDPLQCWPYADMQLCGYYMAVKNYDPNFKNKSSPYTYAADGNNNGKDDVEEYFNEEKPRIEADPEYAEKQQNLTEHMQRIIKCGLLDGDYNATSKRCMLPGDAV